MKIIFSAKLLFFQPDSLKQYIEKLEDAAISGRAMDELFNNVMRIKPPKVILSQG